MSTAAANEPGPVDDGAALDSYSETVIRVARSRHTPCGRH